jgi:hypothetical protein
MWTICLWLRSGSRGVLSCYLFVVYIMTSVAQYISEPGSSVSIVSGTGWTTGRSRLDPEQRRKDFCVQTGSGAQPASCTMGTLGPFPGAKRGRGVTLTTHPHLVS